MRDCTRGRPSTLRQPLIAGIDPPRYRPFVLDQERRNSGGESLADAVLCPRAGRDGSVEGDAQIGAGRT